MSIESIYPVLKQILSLFLWLALPGGLGGLGFLLYGIKSGHYTEEGRGKKFLLDMIGAILLPVIILGFLSLGKIQFLPAFLLGAGWVKGLQIMRNRITENIRTLVGEGQLREGEVR